MEGESVFFTGSAGTGKSRLLLSLIKSLRRKFGRRHDIAVTAMTGLASCSIGGQTLHSWAGIGIGNASVASLIDNIQNNRSALKRWLQAKVLIMDEVSMLDPALLEKLDTVGQTLRESEEPFGGIQLVFTGDFYQLPPIPARGQLVKYAFESPRWKDMLPRQIRLHKVFRQRDTELIDNLNLLRSGQLTEAASDYFRALSREPHYGDDMEPTELFPLRSQVSRANSARLDALPGHLATFEAQDTQVHRTFSLSSERLDELLMVPSRIELKVGAQILLVKNLVQGELVNGTTGRVVGFERPSEDYQDASFVELPVVEWTLPDGSRSPPMLLPAENFDVVQDENIVCTRRQLPCILAWALSIHKSQGQTIERLKIDVGQVFEKGQVYVAISRGVTAEGLQVLNFNPQKVEVDERVKRFDAALEVLSD